MKIRIFGGIASGKSTLASYLGEHLHLPVFCTDDFVYTPRFSKRRSEPERISLMKKKLKNSWIVEGVHFAPWAEYTYKHADIIIILKKSKLVLAKRILKRTFFEEKDHYANKLVDSARLLWMMYRDTSKEMKAYVAIAHKHKKKLYIITDDNYAALLEKIKEN